MGEITTALLGSEPLRLGLPPKLFAAYSRAAAGDATAFLELAKASLDSEREIGAMGALFAAEIPAQLAAIIGGEPERRFLCDLVERQAAMLQDDGNSRLARICLWQAASIYADIHDESAKSRILRELAESGDEDASALIEREGTV